MIKKILFKYHERGGLRLLAAVFNSFVTRIIKVYRIRKALAVFKGRSLKKSKGGDYFYVDPMPLESELDTYYQNEYWGTREEKNLGANLRDFVHYHLLKENIPDFFSDTKKCVINFGAGHGGISNLFWFDGFDVINIEPSGLPQLYDERWITYKWIGDVPDKSIDLIYGSHSLEHVQDIEKFKQQVSRVLKPNALLFWEVPNAKDPKCSSMMNRIEAPHTYYFFKEFFENWFDEVISNYSYDQSHSIGVVENWKSYKNTGGVVIRALGRIS